MIVGGSLGVATLVGPRTNDRGYYRFTVRRGGAAKMRFRAEWTDGAGVVLRSRLAAAGRPIKYRAE
jgi:hypothetical protein